MNRAVSLLFCCVRTERGPDENDGDTAPHPLRRLADEELGNGYCFFFFAFFRSDSERFISYAVYAFLYGSRADSCRSTYGFPGKRILQRVGDARPLWKMIRLLPLPTFRPPFFVLLLTSSLFRPPSHVLPFSSSFLVFLSRLPFSSSFLVFLSRLPFSSFLSHSSSLTLSSSPPPSSLSCFFYSTQGVILLRLAGCKPRSGSGRRQRPVVMVRSGIRP